MRRPAERRLPPAYDNSKLKYLEDGFRYRPLTSPPHRNEARQRPRRQVSCELTLFTLAENLLWPVSDRARARLETGP